MNKKIICLTSIMLLGMVSAGYAADSGICTTLDASWVSKYIWRGFDILDDRAAFQPSINMDLYDSGFSLNVWSSFAGSSSGSRPGNPDFSTVDLEEWNYTVAYTNAIREGETSQVNYAAWWTYYDYPDTASIDADMQEVALSMSMPNVLACEWVPSYTVISMWPAQGGGKSNENGGNRESGGFIHVVGLNKNFTCPMSEQILNFGVDATFNDGTGGTEVDHDWSHLTWNLSTSYDMAGGILTPSVHYQTSMDDSVNENDELWAGISYAMTF